MQDVNWTYIRRSEDIQGVFWTSYVRSIYVLCLRGQGALLVIASISKNQMLEKQQDGLFCTLLSSIQNEGGSFKRIYDFLFFSSYYKDSPVKTAETTIIRSFIWNSHTNGSQSSKMSKKKLLFLLEMYACLNRDPIYYQKVNILSRQCDNDDAITLGRYTYDVHKNCP